MAAPPPTAEDFLNDPRFNRTVTLPADPAHNRPNPFTITYADYGYHNPTDPTQEHVLLFFSPLTGSRLVQIPKDALARKHRIRIINPDRPGFGGTDAAPAAERLTLWRDAVPALLAHLGIRHLHGLAAHSGGALYVLDFVLHHPEFLLPGPYAPADPFPSPSQGTNTATEATPTQTTPTTTPPPPPNAKPTLLALGAPWILPSHSRSLPLSLAQKLPVSAVRQADKLASFVGTHLGPAVGSSIGFAARLLPGKKQAEQREEGSDPGGAGCVGCVGAVEYKEMVEFEERVWPGVMKRVFEGGVEGLGEDAVVFLQKVQSDDHGRGTGVGGGEGEGASTGVGTGMGSGFGWGDWGDYDTLVPRLREALRRQEKRLRVKVYYAEKDIIVRDGGAESEGAKWFDKCWAVEQGSSDGGGDVIEYRSRTVEKVDHDHIWDLRWRVPREVFGEIVPVGDAPEES